jgi:hypothetical protein
MDYNISISTCDRNPAYIHDMMKNLLETSECNFTLYVSGENSDYLTEWRVNPRITIKLADKEVWKEIGGKGPIEKCTANMWQALADSVNTGYDILSMEDDVELCDNWVKHLEECRQKAEELYPNGYIISLFYGYIFNGDKIAPFPLPDYYGTQALLISKKVLPGLAGYFYQRLGELINADMVLKDFMIQHTEFKLLGSVPHLAQHKGVVTTGCGGIPPSDKYRKDY